MQGDKRSNFAKQSFFSKVLASSVIQAPLSPCKKLATSGKDKCKRLATKESESKNHKIQSWFWHLNGLLRQPAASSQAGRQIAFGNNFCLNHRKYFECFQAFQHLRTSQRYKDIS